MPKKGIWYFSYPADGSLKTFPKGVTEVNVLDGAIVFGDEEKGKLSSSLRNIGATKAGGLYLYSEKFVKLQFDKQDWMPIRAAIPVFFNQIPYNCFRLDFSEVSSGYFVIFISKEIYFKH